MPLLSPQAHVTLIALTGALVPTRMTRGGGVFGNATRDRVRGRDAPPPAVVPQPLPPVVAPAFPGGGLYL